MIVERLPKTRSGKVLRGTLKCIINGDHYKVIINLNFQNRCQQPLKMKQF